MKWDGFDLLVLAAAAVLVTAAIAYSITGGDGRAPGRPSARSRPAPISPDIYPRLSSARALLDAGEARESAASLTAIEKEFPAEPETHALLGQAYAKLEDYPGSMREYKAALELSPDYVDKKSEKFIGKRIKAAVKEGLSESKVALARDPGDTKARSELRDAYYIERMLAGGCE